jgi:HD domain
MSPSSWVEEAAERSELVRQALDLAREIHAGEYRDVGDAPFIEHPLAVAEMVAEQKLGEDAIAAALLHDALEYGDVGLDLIRECFGVDVAAIVFALTENLKIEGFEERKKDLRERVAIAGPDAQRVFAADKIANVTVLRETFELVGHGVESSMRASLDEQILMWEYDMEMLYEIEEGVPLYDGLADALVALWGERMHGHGGLTDTDPA